VVTDLPRAVLWDMDGTLLDSEKLWDVAMGDLAADLGIEMTHALRQSTLGNSMPNALAKVFDAAGVPEGDRDFAGRSAWLRTRMSELFRGGIPWMPGAHDVLEMVADQGIEMALVTNTERELTDQALNTIGRHRFAVTVCGDEVAHGKPDPEPYRKAARLLGVDPATCLAIEDSPTGTEAAASAGCAVLVIPSEAAVPAGPRRTQRKSLVGVTLDDLAAAANGTLEHREDLR
jgi:HAD superfamily hydrolase (TIGR01509 family)